MALSLDRDSCLTGRVLWLKMLLVQFCDELPGSGLCRQYHRSMSRDPSNKALSRIMRMVRRRMPSFRARRLASRYCIGGNYRRIYHYHVRKTGGTSLNAAFWHLAGVNLQNFGDRSDICRNGIMIIQGAKKKIEAGHYFFASSHIPAHALKLPAGTFTITLLRNPLERLLSYYRYLLWAAHDPKAREKEPFLRELQPEIANATESFSHFLDHVPEKNLLSQLYMFSRDYDVAEAADRIMTVSALGFTETFQKSLREISERLNLPLQLRHERRFAYRFTLSASEMNQARDMLNPEFQLLAKVIRNSNRRSARSRAALAQSPDRS